MSDIELQPAQPVSSADTPIGNIAHKCVDTPELSALYDENRQWLFDRYQEFFASPDYIPVLRVAEIDDGKTKIRQDRIGSQMFSNMLAHNFKGNKHYQCLTCRQAFMAAFPIWFMNRNGAVVSPMVELQEKIELSFSLGTKRNYVRVGDRILSTITPAHQIRFYELLGREKDLEKAKIIAKHIGATEYSYRDKKQTPIRFATYVK